MTVLTKIFKWGISSSLIHLVLFQRQAGCLHRDNIAFLGLPLLLVGFSEFMVHQCFSIEWLEAVGGCFIKLILDSFQPIVLFNDYFRRLFLCKSFPASEVTSS